MTDSIDTETRRIEEQETCADGGHLCGVGDRSHRQNHTFDRQRSLWKTTQRCTHRYSACVGWLLLLRCWLAFLSALTDLLGLRGLPLVFCKEPAL